MPLVSRLKHWDPRESPFVGIAISPIRYWLRTGLHCLRDCQSAKEVRTQDALDGVESGD
jgi:hypothetical protein